MEVRIRSDLGIHDLTALDLAADRVGVRDPESERMPVEFHGRERIGSRGGGETLHVRVGTGAPAALVRDKGGVDFGPAARSAVELPSLIGAKRSGTVGVREDLQVGLTFLDQQSARGRIEAFGISRHIGFAHLHSGFAKRRGGEAVFWVPLIGGYAVGRL